MKWGRFQIGICQWNCPRVVKEEVAVIMKDMLDIILKYSKSPKLYITIIVFGVIIFFLFPIIYANFFYYSRMHNRVEILSMLSELDYEKISTNEILLNEYYAILQEIELQSTRLIGLGNLNLPRDVIVDSEPIDRFWKFIIGAFLAWAVGLMVPLMNTFEKKSDKPLAFIVMIIIGLFLGLIGMNIPTIQNIWFNHIGFPLFQIFFIAIIAFIATRKKGKKERVSPLDA